jgi:hemolysin activation/secretion protein
MKTSQFLLALTPLSLLVSAAGTQAQTAVGLDAGALRQQIDQQREVRIPQALPATRVAPPPEIKPQAGVTIKIKSIRFEGNRPDGTYAYRVRAKLSGDTQHRVGLKGTAKLNGGWVPLSFWMFRRPWATVRAYLGW